MGRIDYISAMAKSHASSAGTTVWNPETGQNVVVHGAGSLKGRLTLKKGIDLTKPLAAQVMKRAKARRSAPAVEPS